MQIQPLAKKAEKFVLDNSPSILAGLGVAGTITTAYLSGKATVSAVRTIDNYAVDDSKKEILELTWRFYIPPVASGIMTVSCIIAANRIGERRAAALAAAFSISERAFEEYKEKVLDHLGPNKVQTIRDEIAQDRMNRNPPLNREVVITGNGDVLCYDEFSGRYFESQVETIRKAQNDINAQILSNMYASLGEFYNLIGLPVTSYSEEVGWGVDSLVDVKFSTCMNDKNQPCISIDFSVSPVRGYHKLG